MFHADDAARTRGVDELVAADRDAHMRRPWIRRREEQDVARREILGPHRIPRTKLIAHVARQRDAVLREDVLREAAAVEAGGIGAAVAVRRAAQRQRGAGQRVRAEWGSRGRWPRLRRR